MIDVVRSEFRSFDGAVLPRGPVDVRHLDKPRYFVGHFQKVRVQSFNYLLVPCLQPNEAI